MKKSLVFASLLAISSSAMAMDVEYFVSAGGGSGSWDVKTDVKRVSNGASIGSTTNSDNGGFISIQGGTILDKSHKIGLDYTKYNTSGDNSMYSMSIGYDYLFDISGSNWKPLIGLAYTINKYSEDVTNTGTITWDSSSLDLTTNVITARIGVEYDFNDNLFIVASYDYGLSMSGDGDIGLDNSGTKYTATFETEKLNRFGVYVGYKF